METWIPILLFIAVAIAGAVFGSIQAKKRREALSAWAAGYGLSFSHEQDPGFEGRYPDFKLLKSGDRDRYAYNICSGIHHNRPLQAFDYHYVTISTDSKGRTQRSHHNVSALILECETALKPLHIRPEGFLDKIGAAFGFEDINFESAEFSRKYKVTATDRKWAYDVLHARAIEHLLAQQAFSMQFGNDRHIIFWNHGTWKPEQFDGALLAVEGLLDLLPEYLKKQET
jgi:hypothetical protein